jgi:hypothetical protein
MKMIVRPMLIGVALLTTFAAAAAGAQSTRPQTGEAARPGDSAANRPSESGAQTNLPTGATTGAGQPQGNAQPAEAQARNSAKSKSQAKGSARAKTAAQAKPARVDKKRVKRSAKNLNERNANRAVGSTGSVR